MKMNTKIRLMSSYNLARLIIIKIKYWQIKNAPKNGQEGNEISRRYIHHINVINVVCALEHNNT